MPVVELPHPDDDQCVPALLAWLAYPDMADSRRRAQLVVALMSWPWRNALRSQSVRRKDVPEWAKPPALTQRDMLLRLETARLRLRRASKALRAWQLVRGRRGGWEVSMRRQGQAPRAASLGSVASIFDAENPDNFRKRTFREFVPILHLFEQFDQAFSERFDHWERKTPDEGAARAIIDLLRERAWVQVAVRRAAELRAGANKDAGLEPDRSIEFRLAKVCKI